MPSISSKLSFFGFIQPLLARSSMETPHTMETIRVRRTYFHTMTIACTYNKIASVYRSKQNTFLQACSITNQIFKDFCFTTETSCLICTHIVVTGEKPRYEK